MKIDILEYLKEEEEKEKRRNKSLLPTLDELYEMGLYLYDPDVEDAGDRD